MTPPKIQSLEWCAPSELARRWGVSESTIRNLLVEGGETVPKGKIPAVRIGGQLRVHLSAVEAHERGGRVDKPTPAEVGKVVRVGRKRAALLAEPVTNHLGNL